MDSNLCFLQYGSADQAERINLQLGSHCLLAKFDLKSVYCHILVYTGDQCLVQMGREGSHGDSPAIRTLLGTQAFLSSGGCSSMGNALGQSHSPVTSLARLLFNYLASLTPTSAGTFYARPQECVTMLGLPAAQHKNQYTHLDHPVLRYHNGYHGYEHW